MSAGSSIWPASLTRAAAASTSPPIHPVSAASAASRAPLAAASSVSACTSVSSSLTPPLKTRSPTVVSPAGSLATSGPSPRYAPATPSPLSQSRHTSAAMAAAAKAPSPFCFQLPASKFSAYGPGKQPQGKQTQAAASVAAQPAAAATAAAAASSAPPAASASMSSSISAADRSLPSPATLSPPLDDAPSLPRTGLAADGGALPSIALTRSSYVLLSNMGAAPRANPLDAIANAANPVPVAANVLPADLAARQLKLDNMHLSKLAANQDAKLRQVITSSAEESQKQAGALFDAEQRAREAEDQLALLRDEVRARHQGSDQELAAAQATIEALQREVSEWRVKAAGLQSSAACLPTQDDFAALRRELDSVNAARAAEAEEHASALAAHEARHAAAASDMEKLKALMRKLREKLMALMAANPEELRQTLVDTVQREKGHLEEIARLKQELLAAQTEAANAAHTSQQLPWPLQPRKKLGRPRKGVAASTTGAAAAAAGGATGPIGSVDPLQEMLRAQASEARATANIAAAAGSAAATTTTQDTAATVGDGASINAAHLHIPSFVPRRRGRPPAQSSAGSDAAATAAAAATSGSSAAESTAATAAAAAAAAASVDDSNMPPEERMPELEPAAKRAKHTHPSCAQMVSELFGEADEEEQEEEEEKREAVVGVVDEDEEHTSDVYMGEATMKRAVVTPATVAPAAAAPATAAASTPQKAVEPRDDQSVLIEAIATDWLLRMDMLAADTPLSQTPLHLLIPLLCVHMHVCGRKRPAASMSHSPNSFTVCRTQLPKLLLGVFVALLRRLSTRDAAVDRVLAGLDLPALSSAQSDTVHRAATQLHWMATAIAAACAPLPPAHLRDNDSDDSDDEDEEDEAFISPLLGSSNCSCGVEGSVGIVARLLTDAHKQLTEPPQHVSKAALLSIASMSVECGLLSFLSLGVPAELPAAATVAIASSIEVLDPRVQLLQELLIAQPVAPLYLLEHFIATALPSWPRPLRAAPLPVCEHEKLLAAPFDGHLPPPPVCAACAEVVCLQPLVWRSLLTCLLDNFPDEMLRLHLPAISAALTPADDDHEAAGSVAPCLSVSEVCTLLLQRVTHLIHSQQARAAVGDAVGTCTSLLQLVLSVIGTSQSLYLLHHVILPMYALKAQAAGDEADREKTSHDASDLHAPVWRRIIGVAAWAAAFDPSAA